MKIPLLKHIIGFSATQYLLFSTVQSSFAFNFNYPPITDIRPLDWYSYIAPATGARINGYTSLRLVEEVNLGESNEWELLDSFSEENQKDKAIIKFAFRCIIPY